MGALLGLVTMLASSWSLSPTTATVLAFGANFGLKTLHGEWWRLFASMFLHFNILHIGFNVWTLANLGQLMERLVGNLGFLLLYLVSGLLGSVASVARQPATRQIFLIRRCGPVSPSLVAVVTL